MFSYVKNYLYLIVKTEIIKRGAQFNTGTFMSEIHSYCQAAFQMLFSKLIFNLASGLTNIVTPKTQDTYDQIMLFMIFSLDLMNNFFPFFHTAFIKVYPIPIIKIFHYYFTLYYFIESTVQYSV